MKLWIAWFEIVMQLRPACSRMRTFMWLSLSLMAMTVRTDMAGVTSLVRALGLLPKYYDRILDFFHSKALSIDKLSVVWSKVILKMASPFLVTVNGRIVLVGDGIKVPKSGKKMPSVKKLFQESTSNTKPSYIFGHSCQVVSLLAGFSKTVFAIPLIGRIHEGIIFSNRDKKTLLDKMILLLLKLEISLPFYFIADAYYASRNIVKTIVKMEQHLITRVRSNAVAYYPASPSSNHKRGRKKKFGKKIKLRSFWKNPELMTLAQSPLPNESHVSIRYRCCDLIWRPCGLIVRFIAVIHPHKGKIILMSTDLSLNPLEVLRLYALRFKIEHCFKQTLRTIGSYSYHFWMSPMKRIPKKKKNQHLHHESQSYRNAVKRKMDAYHRHIQVGFIAHGIVQYLSLAFPDNIWKSFGSWIRTIRPGIHPSEAVTVIALRYSLLEYFADSSTHRIFKKFITKKIDIHRTEGLKWIA